MEKVEDLRDMIIVRNKKSEENKMNTLKRFVEEFGIDKVAELSKIDKELLENYFIQEKSQGNYSNSKSTPSSVLITPIALEECLKCYVSAHSLFIPKTSYYKEDGQKRLEKYREKVKNREVFKNGEGCDLINVPGMFDENKIEILDEICFLFSRMLIANADVRNQLSQCLDCIIKEYAETKEDRNLLEDKKNRITVECESIMYLEKYRKEGKEKGKEEMARKFIKKIGIDEVSEITGLDKEILKKNPPEKTEKPTKWEENGYLVINFKEELHKNIRNEGKEEGKLETARKFIKKIGIDEVSQISGFTKDDLLNKEYVRLNPHIYHYYHKD